MFPLQDTCSVVSDYDCPCAEVSDSAEDLPDLGPLEDSGYFRDLEEASKQESETLAAARRATPDPHAAAPSPSGIAFAKFAPRPAVGYVVDRGERSGPAGGLSLIFEPNGLLEAMDTIVGSQEEMESSNVDSFPILVRSMSTSRRHSWGVPVSPINLGRR